MHIVKKLLIVFIIIASFVIIYRLLKQNSEVKEQIDKQIMEVKKEGFQDPAIPVKDPAIKAETAMLDKAASDLGREMLLKPIPKKFLDFPLREFMIKSSYNSAIIGETASTEAIDFVLKRGCRLIDFEIHTRNLEMAKETEFVSYSHGASLKTGLTLTLEKAMMFVAANAFSALSPLPDDPIFIHLRFKNHSKEIFTRASNAITTIFGERLYRKPLTGSTPINEIMGKVVIILDAKSSPNYEKQANCDGVGLGCTPYTEYVGLVSGTADLPKYTYEDYYELTSAPIMVSQSNRTDNMRFIMITPPDSSGNVEMLPDVDNLKKLPIQMMLVPFYKQNDKLKKYEEIFNKCKSAFCPLGTFIRE